MLGTARCNTATSAIRSLPALRCDAHRKRIELACHVEPVTVTTQVFQASILIAPPQIAVLVQDHGDDVVVEVDRLQDLEVIPFRVNHKQMNPLNCVLR